MSQTVKNYYVPHSSYWPIVASIGLFLLVKGFSHYLNNNGGTVMMMMGMAVILVMVVGWFGAVIRESQAGLYSAQVDRSFRWGMGWFIFSEVMFFAAFFGALFYIRFYSVPWLGGGHEAKILTNEVLWPDFRTEWPSNGPANVGGDFQTMSAWGLPAINTLILLASGMTLTWSHWGMKLNNRRQLILGLVATVVLGIIFLCLQVLEYAHAYNDLGLTLGSGVYGSTFFLLTGFHGLHVTLGVIMLIVITLRCMKGHFTEENHFGYEATAWYWHFVDVVWLFLFVFVYWL